jgi:oxalate decarboxylase
MAKGAYETFSGGQEHRVTVDEFPISTTMSGVVMELEPGAGREPHWHPNADEWQYLISGQCDVGMFGSSSRARGEHFRNGDAGYIPRGYGHYIENTGQERLRILIGFNAGKYEEISLSTWLAANPEGVLADNFKTSDELVKALPDHRVFIASKDGPPRA